MTKKNILYITIIAILMFSPLIFLSGMEFAGVDSQIGGKIEQINPTYIPWIENLSLSLTPEMETFMFSFQAAIGAGIIGYILGYIKGKNCVK